MFLKIWIILSVFKIIYSDPYYCKRSDSDKYFDIYSDKCFAADNEFTLVEKLVLIKRSKLNGYGSLCKTVSTRRYFH